MKTTDALRHAIKASGYSMRSLSTKAGKSENYVSGIVGQAERTSGELTAATISTISNICGYGLALVPKEDLPATALVIDPPDENDSKSLSPTRLRQARKERQTKKTHSPST